MSLIRSNQISRRHLSLSGNVPRANFFRINLHLLTSLIACGAGLWSLQLAMSWCVSGFRPIKKTWGWGYSVWTFCLRERNGLHKSHLTYLIASKGRSTVAHYCGASEETFRKYYQEPLKSRTTREEKWFDVCPVPGKVFEALGSL